MNKDDISSFLGLSDLCSRFILLDYTDLRGNKDSKEEIPKTNLSLLKEALIIELFAVKLQLPCLHST